LSQAPASEVSRPKVMFSIDGLGEAHGEFFRFAAPRTSDALLRNLPVHGRAVRYGEEVYFQVAVKAPAEKPRSNMEVGSLGYWPQGDAICVFYGPTRPYSPVNLLGRITIGLELFGKLKEGAVITVRKV
jgi:hypothetical protein